MVTRRGGSDEAPVESIEVGAYDLPTEKPEQDGTAEWNKTTLVTVHLRAGGQRGFGYTYADGATARFIHEILQDVVVDQDAMGIPKILTRMIGKVRNHGRQGVAAMAISAVDVALWDVKAKLLGQPLVKLLGPARSEAAVYGSGGFTNLSLPELRSQLSGWAMQGMRAVKMKVGRDMSADEERVRTAREAIGPDVQLFVDANGAWDRKQALRMAEVFAGHDVRWFEEPVSSDDLEGLRLLRDRAPALLEITAGEYGFHPAYFRRMLEAGAVDVMMADGSRCLGISGLLAVASVCDAFSTPLSAHCAPHLHLHPACSIQRYRHMEYFHDHARIEAMLFDGAVAPEGGVLRPDLSRPGLGVELKREDAQRLARS
jgi:L-alanine-DL-glutamate epimerase-like enolase superfamily enzyme